MITSRALLNYYLEQDAITLSVKKRKWIGPFNSVYKFERILRKLEYYSNTLRNNFIAKLIPYIYYRLRFRHISMRLGFSIPINCFGPGLSIPHYGTIIVNSNAKIGANCRLHAGVNIGASAGNPKAPEIGDNGYIGPGAIIFGDIKIADNVTIGANATVNKSCLKKNVVIAGTPAKIVKENMENWMQFNKISN